MEAELLGTALTGVDAPEVNGEVPGDGDDGFLALGSGGACSFGQQWEAGFDRGITWLESHESPRELD